MAKKHILFWVIIISLFLILIGCGTSHTIAKQNDTETNIEEIVKYLSSDQLKGRLTGTKENQEGEQYINEWFEKIGLDKYNGDSYSIPYNHLFYDLSSQSIEMSIKFSDGTIKNCALGKDYFPQSLIKDTEISLPITFDTRDKNLENTMVVLRNNDEISEVYGKCRGVLLEKKSFKKYINVKESGFPIIQISPELYKLLQEKSSEVSIKYNLDPKDIIANNVIGVIKGEHSKNAIVISAHFDHVGFTDYDIYNGAIDNASGIGVLINTAEKIKAYSDKKKLSSDIIICAFNGEESLLQGSKAFVENLKRDYENVVNINIDCVGIKNGGKLLITGDEYESKSLIDIAQNYFLKDGYDVDVVDDGSIVSDHISFSQRGIPSICLIQDNIEDIHTSMDTNEKIDLNYLNKLSEKLAEFIILRDIDFFNFNTSEKGNVDGGHDYNDVDVINNDKVSEAIESAKEELEFNEYKFIEIEDKIRLAYNGIGKFDNYQDFKEPLFELSVIPEMLNDYKFKQSTLIFSPNITYEDKNVEINKTYYYDKISSDNITCVSLEYFNDSSEDYLSISIFSPYEESELIKSFCDEESVFSKKIVIDNHEFNVLYSKNQQQIISIETFLNVNYRQAIVGIIKWKSKTIEHEGKELIVDAPCWDENSDEHITGFIKDNNLYELLDNIVKNIY